ncbi:unnamed protein product, partial [Scytosiphon promiscuus]
PVLQLLSPVTHPWVNTYLQVVGHPDLHAWDGTNPPLIGDIVAAVIQEFGRDSGGVSTSRSDQATTSWLGTTTPEPTGFLAHPAPQSFGTTNPVAGNGGVTGIATGERGRTHAESSPQRRGRQARTRVDHTPTPAIPASFSELQGLSSEKLTRLLDDESARQTLLLGMASVEQMKVLRTDVRKGNMETARLTLSKQDAASDLRKEGEAMKMELKCLQKSYEGKAHSGNRNMGGTADQVILKRVKHASKITDTSSERIAKDFLEEGMQAHDFLEEFLKERQRYHMLAAKIECMKRDIRF